MDMTQRRAEVWTTRRLLRWMTGRFEAKGVDAPRVVAEMLLAHVLGCERMRLYMEADRPAAPAELAALRDLVVRAQGHVPVQYLTGLASFFGRELSVDRSTMIPQPCTEDLVQAVLDWLSDHGVSAPLIADVGTGSGCIAISLALALPSARVVATDVAPEPLDLARRNAERFGVADRVELVEGSLLEPLRGRADADRFDVLCSNPPYISDHEWDRGQVQRAVREHVPPRALRGGPDGLDHVRPLIEGAGALLKTPGLLAIEIAGGQREAALDLAERAGGLERATVRKDCEGFWRVLLAERAH